MVNVSAGVFKILVKAMLKTDKRWLMRTLKLPSDIQSRIRKLHINIGNQNIAICVRCILSVGVLHSPPPPPLIKGKCNPKYNEWRERERNVLFNDVLNTFYLRLYGVRHMVKDHSDSEKGNPLPPHRLFLSINSKGSFICTIPQTG